MAKKKSKKQAFNFNDFVASLDKKGSPRDKDFEEERQYFLIVSEGQATEPNYFKSLAEKLPEQLVKVETEGIGQDPLNVVKAAIELREKRKDSPLLPQFDEVWAVFDKDDFPDENFNNAIEKADNEDINPAYSNEAFELWYILHFQYLDTAINREQYISILKSVLGDYEKNDTEMYDKLQQHPDSDEAQAIKFAEKLYEKRANETPAKDKPVTRVYKLVEILNKFKR